MPVKLDLTSLRIFLAVAAVQNITRASEREHIAPSAVSKRLSDMEETFGIELFYRLPRGVKLTPAGEAFQHHAREILRSADRLVADLGDFAKGIKGHVRMMANASSLSEFLPRDLSRFCGFYPDINVDLQEVTSSEGLKAVVEGRCDMAVFVGESAGDMNGCRIHDYREDNFVLILPAGHRFAGMDSIWFAETLDEYFIGPELVTAWDDTISRAALDARRAVRYRMRLKSSLTVVNMVAAGLGISVMPYGMLAAISRDTGLQTVRLKDAWAKRMIKLAVREDDALSMPARLMVKHLLQRDHEQAV